MQTQYWASTAVVIPMTTADGMAGTNQCGSVLPILDGLTGAHAQGRCSYGPRHSLLVISPYARQNYVDHTITDQTSVIRFVEDNWLAGDRIGHGSFDSVANSIASMLQIQPTSCFRYGAARRHVR